MTPPCKVSDETIEIISSRIHRLYIEELRSCVREFYHPQSLNADVKRTSYSYQPPYRINSKGYR